MYWLCMIVTIPLATGNKLNCFISARGMLAIVWHCVLLFCCFLLCVFFVDFLHVNKSSSQKKKKCVNVHIVIYIYKRIQIYIFCSKILHSFIETYFFTNENPYRSPFRCAGTQIRYNNQNNYKIKS